MGLIASWLFAVPGSVASGALLGTKVTTASKAGAFIAIFLTSLMISFDICSRAGCTWRTYLPLAAVLSLVAYIPWVLTVKKSEADKTRAAALPFAGLLYSIVLLGTTAFIYGSAGTVSRSAGLQGAVITLMYIFISNSLGYQAVRTKGNPAGKAQTIYMASLLALLTMFDILGASADKVAQAKAMEANVRKGETGLRNITNAAAEARQVFESSPAGLAAFDAAIKSGAGLVNAKEAAAKAATTP